MKIVYAFFPVFSRRWWAVSGFVVRKSWGGGRPGGAASCTMMRPRVSLRRALLFLMLAAGLLIFWLNILQVCGLFECWESARCRRCQVRLSRWDEGRETLGMMGSAVGRWSIVSGTKVMVFRWKLSSFSSLKRLEYYRN